MATNKYRSRTGQTEAAQGQLQIEQERTEQAGTALATLRRMLQDRGISLDENVM